MDRRPEGGGLMPELLLRIDKGSPGGALYLGTCIYGYGSCNGILYKL